MRQRRGELTDRIKAKSLELMGREISTTELRLMPYIMFVMTDGHRVDRATINGQERDILQQWRDAGYIAGGASGLSITNEFWNILTELVFLGYVDLFDESEEPKA